MDESIKKGNVYLNNILFRYYCNGSMDEITGLFFLNTLNGICMSVTESFITVKQSNEQTNKKSRLHGIKVDIISKDFYLHQQIKDLDLLVIFILHQYLKVTTGHSVAVAPTLVCTQTKEAFKPITFWYTPNLNFKCSKYSRRLMAYFAS